MPNRLELDQGWYGSKGILHIHLQNRIPNRRDRSAVTRERVIEVIVNRYPVKERWKRFWLSMRSIH